MATETSLIENLRHLTLEARAATKLAAHNRTLSEEQERQTKQAADDKSALAAVEPLIPEASRAMQNAAMLEKGSADIYKIPSAECSVKELKPLDRKDPRAFTGAARGLALWALEQQLRFEVVTRDNDEWLSISWEHTPTPADSQRQTKQRESAKKVDLGAFLDHLTRFIRKQAAEPKVTAAQRIDVEHHIRWSKKIVADDVESAAVSIVAGANALGLKLEDFLSQ